MSEELYINDQLIDLPERVVAQTKQVNDVGDVVDRQANYSNNIKIPRTSNNIKTFEMLGIAGNTTRLPYTLVKVKYVLDGIELISGGKGVVKNTNAFYNLVIYDGAVSMADLLGNDTLAQLDYSAYNHDLTSSTFTSSFSKTDGYIYALGKFYENANTTVLNVDLQNLSFYLHTLFEIIFTQKGWAISGDIFSELGYLKRLISMDIGYDRTAAGVKTQKYTRDNSGDPAINETFGLPTLKEYLIDSYTATSSNVFNITALGSFNLIKGSGAAVNIYLDGAFTPVHSFDLEATVDEDFNLEVDSGQLIEIKISVASEDVLGTETIRFSTAYVTTIFENELKIPIAIEDIIGNTRQIDLVKDIMQRYGLIFRKVRDENAFEFVQMSELLADVSGAEDWSSKYSNFQNESYKPSYGQRNLFKYTYETEDTNEAQSFADGEMLVANLNLKQEKTVLTSIFKSSVLKAPDFYGLRHWVLKDEDIVANKDGLRIFEVKRINTSINYRYNDTVEAASTFTGDTPYLDFEPVKYQNELDNNYIEFNAMLNDYNKSTLVLNLSILDIYALDFFKLKYFNQLGAYYYLNKVRNFKKNKLTSCELVRIGKA